MSGSIRTCVRVLALAALAGNPHIDTAYAADTATWSAPVPPARFWARDFVESVGTNVHLLHSDSLYGTNFALFKQRLVAARIRHVRDGALDQNGNFSAADQAARFQELGRAGIGVTFIFRMSASAAFVQGFPARVSPAFEAYELPNELNVSNASPWPSAIQSWMPVFRHYVKDSRASASYPILGPSLADLGNDPYGQLGLQAEDFDYGNLHKYYRNYNPRTAGYGGPGQGPCTAVRYGSLNYALCNTTRVSGSKPVICTESGYGTDTTSRRQVTPEVQARFIPRMLLLHLKAGIARTYIYQFTDYGSDGFGAFGLLKADGSPKPAYTELSALLTELDDTAQSRPTDELTLAVTGDFQDVETVLFEKSDGSYRLAIWLEKPAYDPKSGAALEVPSQVVALAMPPSYHARRLLTFSDTGAMITRQLAGTASSLEISVQDNVTLVDIARIGS